MKTKTFIVIASVIGAVATVCTIAGFAIHDCLNELDNVNLIFDLPEKEEK